MRFLHFLSANLHFTIFLTKFAKRNIFTLSHNFICVFKISTMDLINRLKHYMDIHQITISQFADRCGIPRPTMSQLINGRNKRISDEVINKVHSAFPDLSILWLMFGEGDMESNPNIKISGPQINDNEVTNLPYDAGSQSNTPSAYNETGFSNPVQTSNSFENLLFDTSDSCNSVIDCATSGENIPKDNILFDTPETPASTAPFPQPLQQQPPQQPQTTPLSNDITHTLHSPAPASTTASPVENPSLEKKRISISPDAHKKITNIVVFYSDNSFQSFLPDA